MTRASLRAAAALAVLIACGGTAPSTSIAPGATAVPPSPASPTSPPPAPAPADAGPASPATPPGAATASCSTTLQVVNDHSEYDERCSADGKTRSRQCTLGTGEPAWACLCTAPSGAVTSCQAPASGPGIAPPADCCPRG